MSETPLKNEATRETVEFKHFDQTWTVPAKQRLSHMETFRQVLAQSANPDLAMVHAYLPASQVQALLAIDPDRDELDEFTTAMAKALGYDNAGN
jgi:hypothetical protein